MNIDNRKVHLVLGSGGARGIAHIGVIQELEKHGCEIVSVSGCSMGAVVGGIYCTGKLPVFTEWLLGITKKDIFSLMDFTLSTSGLIKGEKIMHIIEDLIGTYNINDLKIPFTAVATDISNGKEAVYTEGNLYRAIRASMGIPSLFMPLIDNDRLIIDGGILDPLPISQIKKNGDDEIIVAVNLSGKPAKKLFPIHDKEKEVIEHQDYFGIQKEKIEHFFSYLTKKDKKKPDPHIPNVINILTETIYLMQDKVTEQTIKNYKPDILVNIRRDYAGIMDFHLASKILNEGAKAFNRALKCC